MLISTQEWLALTRNVDNFWKTAGNRDYYEKEYHGHFPNKVRPRIVCVDGFSVSIQAGDGLYCCPRENLEDGKYETVELGYPSEEESLIAEYAEDPEELCDTVYAQVPVEVVDEMIRKHGGIVNVEEVNKYLRSENK